MSHSHSSYPANIPNPGAGISAVSSFGLLLRPETLDPLSMPLMSLYYWSNFDLGAECQCHTPVSRFQTQMVRPCAALDATTLLAAQCVNSDFYRHTSTRNLTQRPQRSAACHRSLGPRSFCRIVASSSNPEFRLGSLDLRRPRAEEDPEDMTLVTKLLIPYQTSIDGTYTDNRFEHHIFPINFELLHCHLFWISVNDP